VNFILSEMTFLRYFMPLIIEANKRGVKSNLYIGRNNKYNNPHSFMDQLKNLSQEYDFHMRDISEAHNCKGITFLIEGVDVDRLDRSKTKIISITYMTDFSGLYDSYVDKVDSIIFPSEYFAKLYDKTNSKNLYLGSPKYDVLLDKNKINQKYGLTNNKKALIIYPRTRDKNKIDLNGIYSSLRSMGYDIVVKSRGKDPINDRAHKGDAYFSDKSWFPHTTIELIEVSDVVVNFNSTSIKECVLAKTPLINFNVKPWMPLEELYDYDYCKTFPKFDEQQFKQSIETLTSVNLSQSFDEAIDKHLFRGNSSARILDHLGVL
jgi:hypothetical protein